MKILFTGGGTMGSVTPLLAVAQQLGDHDLYFIGTRRGPERKAASAAGISFTAITAAKFRRYWSPWQLVVPFQLLAGMWQAFWAIGRIKPAVIVSAGSFVDVPVVWMGWVRGIASVIHQQDIHPGLAIKLMKPFARTLTVAFEESLNDFPQAEWIGNPVRDLTPTTNEFSLDTSVPTVLIMGGGTGAQAINELVTAPLCEHANVIHVTGRGREGKMEQITHTRYHKRTYLGEEMKEALAAAQVIVSRAGLGAITELAALGKPSLSIPMPNSHQEKNAQLLKERDAAIVLEQKNLNSSILVKEVTALLADKQRQHELSANIRALFPKNGTQKFVERIVG